jgi:hypothetical protein
MVRVLKRVWISSLLPEGYSFLITQVKLHDKWGPRLEISCLELRRQPPDAWGFSKPGK